MDFGNDNDDDDTQDQSQGGLNTDDTSEGDLGTQAGINDGPLSVIKDALAYGRQTHGLAEQAGVNDIGASQGGVDDRRGEGNDATDLDPQMTPGRVGVGATQVAPGKIPSGYGINGASSEDKTPELRQFAAGGPVEEEEPGGLPQQAGDDQPQETEQGGLPEDAPQEEGALHRIGRKNGEGLRRIGQQVAAPFAAAGKALNAGVDALSGGGSKAINTGIDVATGGLNATADDTTEGVRQIGVGLGEGITGQDIDSEPQQRTPPPNPKRILQYLQGADAAVPEAVARYEELADPARQKPEGERKMGAVAAASQEGGKEAAWKVLQKYRQDYDSYRAHAAGALAHNDVVAAARSATQAYPNVPDGMSVSFAPSQNGVTATVSDGTQVPLTVPQFNQWLLGKEGQYDHVMELGTPTLLKQLSQSQGLPVQQATQLQGTSPQQNQKLDQMAGQPQQPGQQQPGQLPPTEEGEMRPFASPKLAGQQPGKYRSVPQGYRSPEPEADTTDPLIAKRAAQMFPMMSQADQKASWIAGQEQQAKHNEIETIKAKREGQIEERRLKGQDDIARAVATGNSRVEERKVQGDTARDVAGIRAEGYKDRTTALQAIAQGKYTAQMQETLAKIAGQTQNARAANLAKMAMEAQKGGIFGQPIPPEIKRYLENQFQNLPAGGGGQQQPAQQQRPTQQQQQPDQHQQALEWANAHPNDPRAAQIKQRLQGQ